MKPSILLSLFALLGHGLAHADSAPSYSYLDAAYANYEAENSQIDTDGFRLKASYAIDKKLFVQGAYETIGSDVDMGQAGVGVRLPLSPNADFYAHTDVIHHALGQISDTGFDVGVGLRARINPQVEIGGSAVYSDIFDHDQTSFTLESRYYFNPGFGVGVAWENTTDTDINKWLFSVRAEF